MASDVKLPLVGQGALPRGNHTVIAVKSVIRARRGLQCAASDSGSERRYLSGKRISFSEVSTTNMASSLAGSVVLALALTL